MRQDDDENRRTPEELAVLFEVEPTLREIIVEGRSDAGLLRWFFAVTAPDAEVQFYAIQDRVWIENERVNSLGYSSGNRGRVIATAQIVSSKSPDQRMGAFVADRDCAAIGLDSCPQINGLYYSDFTSVELYFLNAKSIGKLLAVTLRAPRTIAPQAVIDAISPSLLTLFKIRAVLRDLNPAPKLAAKVIEQLKISIDGSSTLDPKEAFQKSHQGDISGLLSRYEAINIPEESDTRHYIFGHDICAVLIRYLQTVCPQVFRDDRRHLTSPSSLEISLLTSAEIADLVDFNLFADLAGFISSDNP